MKLVQQLKCGVRHPYATLRASPQLPIDYKRVCAEDPDFQSLSAMDTSQIESLFKTTNTQFTKAQLLKRCYYFFKLKFQKYDSIANDANKTQNLWFQNQLSEAMNRHDWNNDIYNELHNKSVKESEDIHASMDINNIDNTMEWLDYLSLPSTQPWTTMLTAKIINDLIIESMANEERDSNDTYDVLDIGCGTGHFATLLKSELFHADCKYLHKINMDGIDISNYCIEKAKESNEYRQLNQINLCDSSHTINKKYQFIISCDTLQQSGFGGLPGVKCIEELMDCVSDNGYFVITNSIISASYNCISFYNDVLNDIWSKKSFQCIADLQFRNLGGLFYPKNEFESEAYKQSCIFVKIMKKI